MLRGVDNVVVSFFQPSAGDNFLTRSLPKATQNGYSSAQIKPIQTEAVTQVRSFHSKKPITIFRIVRIPRKNVSYHNSTGTSRILHAGPVRQLACAVPPLTGERIPLLDATRVWDSMVAAFVHVATPSRIIVTRLMVSMTAIIVSVLAVIGAGARQC